MYNINSTPFDTLHDFLYDMFFLVFTRYCHCLNEECVIPDLFKVAPFFYETFNKVSGNDIGNKNSGACNTLKVQLTYEESDLLVDTLIRHVQQFNLLSERNGRFYILDGYKRLSWKNIMTLEVQDAKMFFAKHQDHFEEFQTFFSDTSTANSAIDYKRFVVLIKSFYWYMRKITVDSLISPILIKNKIQGISVGSTNITSDYDITLYGKSFTKISETIEEFNTRFKTLFGETSDFVFDTNVYGVSFINVSDKYPLSISPTVGSPSSVTDEDTNFFEYNDKLSDEVNECNNKKFKYVKSNKETHVSQHIWAVVKVLVKLDIISGYDSTIANMLTQELTQTTDPSLRLIIQEAEKFINMYQPSPKYYYTFIKTLKDVDPSQVDDALFNNFVSFANYNGVETYFTRGAFLHIVVNMQMCKNNQKELALSGHEYLDSFIENMSDLLHHYSKVKYYQRAKAALIRLKSSLSTSTFEQVQATLDRIHKLQGDCSDMGKILQCSSFMLMNQCISCILQVTIDFLNGDTESDINSGIQVFNEFLKTIPK